MDSWQNPFGATRHNSSVTQKAFNIHEEFSDDEDSGDHIFYNHNHLESLHSLYQRGKQDTTQCTTANNVEDSGQRHSMINSSLPSKQEGKVWTSFQVQPSEQERKALSSLEKLHAFSFGWIPTDHLGTQSENCLLHHSQAENSTTDFSFTENQNSLHKNNSQQFQSGSAPDPYQLRKRQHYDYEELEAGVEEAGNWSRIFKEAEELDENCHETTSSAACAPHPDKTKLLRGNPTKHRFKFSIRRAKLPFYGKPNSNHLQDNSTNMSITQRFDALAKCDVSAEDSRQLPMVEQLEGLFENNTKSPCSSYKLRGISTRKEARFLIGGKRVLPSPSSRCNVANEDILDSFDHDELSRDGENSGLRANMSTSKGREQTMTDLFQEALNADPVDENSACFTSRFKGTIYGFSDRLQNVLVHEKRKHMQFLKMIHLGEKLHDEIKCIDVRILAKSFEAKLMICKCTVEKALESTQSIRHDFSVMESKRGDITTVIFSSRTSGHLEIEVGNLVRIHRPWKEIRLEEHKIIVCAYFCEMALT